MIATGSTYEPRVRPLGGSGKTGKGLRAKRGIGVEKGKDCFTGGSVMPGRNYTTSGYRYGFQGQESDDEIKGEGNSWNFKYRMYDPRIVRFFKGDPVAFQYPFNSPYAFSENKTIQFRELEGAEVSRPAYMTENGLTTAIDMTGQQMTNEWQERAHLELMRPAMLRHEQTASAFSPTWFQELRAYSRAPSVTFTDFTARVGVSFVIEPIDGISSFVTSFQLTQSLFGLHGPILFDGTAVQLNERLDYGLTGMTSLFFGRGLPQTRLGLLGRSNTLSYSKYLGMTDDSFKLLSREIKIQHVQRSNRFASESARQVEDIVKLDKKVPVLLDAGERVKEEQGQDGTDN